MSRHSFNLTFYPFWQCHWVVSYLKASGTDNPYFRSLQKIKKPQKLQNSPQNQHPCPHPTQKQFSQNFDWFEFYIQRDSTHVFVSAVNFSVFCWWIFWPVTLRILCGCVDGKLNCVPWPWQNGFLVDKKQKYSAKLDRE